MTTQILIYVYICKYNSHININIIKQFILSLLIILANISNISAEVVPPYQILQTNITYSYNVTEGNVLNSKTVVTFNGNGLNNTGISRGTCTLVLSKTPYLDNYSECYYSAPYKQILLNKPGVESNYIFPLEGNKQYRLISINNDSYYTLTHRREQIPNGIYYQYILLKFALNPAGSWAIIKEANNQMIKVKDGLYYAAKKADPTPEPEPEKKFDLSVESIKVTPNSNSINGDVKASVTIKNNGNKTVNNCCVRFFLSKYNTVYKPYQYLFSTVFKLGSLDAGKSTTHEETLNFLSQSAASPGSYYIIADVYSSTAEKEDSDDTNNQKATPFTIKSGKSLNIINNRSSIQITNITEEDLGNTIYITGSNARSIKEIPINTTNEINITNNWSDPILFITIIDKDGNRKDTKINNTK